MPNGLRETSMTPSRLRSYLFASLTSLGLLAACVDTTPPWEKPGWADGSAGGAGGAGSGGSETPDLPATGVGGSTSVADALKPDLPLGAGGGSGGNGGGGGEIDSGVAGADGAMDASGGQGGPDSAEVDAPMAGSDGASGGTGGGLDGQVAQGGSGGQPDGAAGTGGASPDVGPDVGRDVTPDLGVDLAEAGIPLTGLVAYYPCEGGNGSTLKDMSGSSPANDGTLAYNTTADAAVAGYGFVSGKIGNALSLARAGGGYVSLPPSIFAGATEITIATWVKVTTAQNWQRVFDVGIDAKQSLNTLTGTSYMNLVSSNAGNQVMFAITTNGISNEQTLTGTALSSAWTHIAIVLSAGKGSLYVNSQAVLISSLVTLNPASLGAINYAYIGKSQFSADPYFDGQVDELRIYRRALTSDEILALYQFTGP
jgi:hypothetical protein